jgi:hypothetical protein
VLDRAHRKSPLVDFRAPRIWIFLSSLQEASFSTLLVDDRIVKKLEKDGRF